ncbi:MAG: hypothetical protein LBH56_02685 [Coriobacteriales bacterium]|jgi:amino acid transporter|nr:hypothetical protein [Coriobacteriales bacterium]
MNADTAVLEKAQEKAQTMGRTLANMLVFLSAFTVLGLLYLLTCMFMLLVTPELMTTLDYTPLAGFMPLSKARLLATPEIVSAIAVHLFTLGIVLAILLLAASLFRGIVRDNRPFGKPQSRLLRWMGTLMLIIFCGRTVLIFLIGLLLSPDIPLDNTFILITLVLGLLFYCLSYIFEYGHVLQVESDETL